MLVSESEPRGSNWVICDMKSEHINFVSDDGLVRVITTTKPRRFPPHSYPCVVVRLQVQPGTRVLGNGILGVEWMPRYSDILAIVKALGIGGVDMSLKDKPVSIRETFELLNALRLSRKRPNS